MSDWWLCKAGVRLFAQVDRRWPDRDHASDGSVGDTSHQARPSDHNPDPDTGVVRAIDIDADLGTPQASQRLANQLVACAGKGRARGRVAYVIHRGRIASATSGWKWRPYDGTDPHDRHIHVSFTPAGDHDGHRFRLSVFTEPGRIKRLIKRLRRRIRRARRRLRRIT